MGWKLYSGIALLLLLIAGAASAQTQAKPAEKEDAAFPSTDCAAKAASLKKGSTRVYIGLRGGADGSGRSMADARDGSTVAAFDSVLRCYSEGCADPANPKKSVARTENLIVCLGPGTFRTKGNYDYLIAVSHPSQEGFSVGKGWKIHGQGIDKTRVQLSAYFRITDPNDQRSYPLGTGMNTVFSTNSDDASGVEISDLTVDDNFPELKSYARQNGIKALNLEGIHLRSNQGGHWIHNVKVVHAAGEVGGLNPRYETFPVWIFSVRANSSPADNNGNIIENVTMTDFHGGLCTAIAVANAVATVRNNVVDGYQIGYGGWAMGPVVFRDNTAINTEYGFNIDSLANNGVRIESTRIIHPRKYGLVIGGGGTYADFQIVNNTIQLDKADAIGLVFQGNVTRAVFSGNKILVDNSGGTRATAVTNLTHDKSAGANHDNVYESNTVTSTLKVVFRAPSEKTQNCFHNNKDDKGNPHKNLPDNRQGPCPSATSK